MRLMNRVEYALHGLPLEQQAKHRVSLRILSIATTISTHDLDTMAVFSGGHCRVDEPAAAGSDSLSQGGEPDTPGKAWPETHPFEYLAEATVSPAPPWLPCATAASN
jgi:hypothetical protein